LQDNGEDEVWVSGQSIEEATEKACKQLNVSKDDLVLEQGRQAALKKNV
jgi:hypothetical protein